MLKRLLALLTVFVLSTTLCIPVTAYGQEPDENSAVVENFDEIADEISFAEETFDSDDERLQSIIARLEEANGKVPKNFTLDDMNFCLDHLDNDTLNNLMCKMQENAIPVPVPEGSGKFERNIPARADTYLSYDCTTGESEEVPFKNYDEDSDVLLEHNGEIVGDFLPAPRATADFWWELNPENYYDAKVVARIYIFIGELQYVGTGFLIEDNVLITAGHNLYNTKEYGGWCDYITVYPCATEKNHTPYGTASSIKMAAGDFYGGDEFPGNDWGIVRLNKSFSIGYLGLTKNSAVEKGRSMQLEGYPGSLNDKGEPTVRPSLIRNWNLYVSPGVVSKDINEWCKYAKAGTIVYGGMSGGPILYKNSAGRWVAGGIISGRETNQQTAYCAFDANLILTILDFCDA